MDRNERALLCDRARKSMECIRRELVVKYVYMAPAILGMELLEDEKEESISTDGQKIYYRAEYICEILGDDWRHAEKLRRCYLHMMAHCLLRHVWCKKEEQNPLFDQCADLCAEAFVKRIMGISDRSHSAKLPEVVKEFQNVVKRCRVNELLYCIEKDDRMKKLAEDVGNKTKRDDHRRWVNTQSGFELWCEIGQNLALLGSSKTESSLNSKKYGHSAGTETDRIRVARENASDYRELLKEYCEWKEMAIEDFESYDNGWYMLGMELYGNIPLIEYPEVSERIICDDIVIAIDTSGSCSGDIASRFLRETCNLIRDMDIREKVNIRILECDVEIQKEVIIQAKEDIPNLEEVEMSGWGGTSFVPVFQYVDDLLEKNENLNVRVLIYFSDGYGDFPKQKPEYDTVFVLTESQISSEIPDWIRQIVLTEEGLKSLEMDRNEIKDERITIYDL